MIRSDPFALRLWCVVRVLLPSWLGRLDAFPQPQAVNAIMELPTPNPATHLIMKACAPPPRSCQAHLPGFCEGEGDGVVDQGFERDGIAERAKPTPVARALCVT